MGICLGLRTTQWEFNYLTLATVELSRATAKFWLVGVLQTAIQINLQLSLAALGAYATGVIDFQIVTSVVLSIVCYLPDFPEALGILKLGHEAWRSIPRAQCLEIEDKEYRDKVLVERKLFMRKLVRLHLYVMLYAMVLLYAMYKLVGLYTCPNYLINVTGCV